MSFIQKLSHLFFLCKKPTQAKVIRTIELLAEYGGLLGMPHVKYLGDGMCELRVRGQQEVRFFYTVENDVAILVHGYIKKSQKTPVKELETAKKRSRMLTNI